MSNYSLEIFKGGIALWKKRKLIMFDLDTNFLGNKSNNVETVCLLSKAVD